MNKQLRFNKLLYDEKFAALAIDQGTSLKKHYQRKEREKFYASRLLFFQEANCLESWC